MQILVEKIFPIEHKLFYLQFEEWKKTLSEYIKTKEDELIKEFNQHLKHN